MRGIELREEGTLTNPTDPFMRQEARALIRRFGRTPGLPVRVPLDRAGDVSLIGRRRADVLAVARAILVQTAACHAPDDMIIAVAAGPARAQDWDWTRWLPHLLDRGHIGAGGPNLLLAPDTRTLGTLLADDIEERAKAAAKSHRHGSGAQEARVRPRLLVIDDAHGEVAHPLPVPDQHTDLRSLGITVVHLLADRLHEPSEISCRVTVDGDTAVVEHLTDASPTTVTGTVDDLPRALAEGIARKLAPLRLSPDSYDDGTGTPPADFGNLLGLADPQNLAVSQLWRPRGERDFLRVPFGVDAHGRPILLDLKESAQFGMGPHGLCVGATGSGKSELLRTLVLSLVATHPPDRLSMVLVDYKGGATFAPFTELPHVAGLITNLASDASLVERMYTSLDGEVLRRQQVLADAGKITDITAYNLLRAEQGRDTGLPPMGHLLVLIDEFGELLTAKPEFVELFLRIGRIGRSIGVHLLLSSQRVEQGKMRGLDTYLSYRIGLRTLSEMESRTVLDAPDAFHLPPLPGNGYLKVDVTLYEKFKAAYVSGPLTDSIPEEVAPAAGPMVMLMPRFGRVDRVEPADPREPAEATKRTTGPTLLSTVVSQLAKAAEPVQPIWLPPLPAAVTLDRAAGGFEVTGAGIRLRAAEDRPSGLRVPLGLLDDPARQWQGPWLVDLTASGGHLAVLGGPGSGKSTALRTLALGLAASRTPTEVGIYGIDLLGGGLRALDKLPHVGGTASRDDRERIRRAIDEMSGMLAEREQLFARHQLDNAEELRAERANGRLSSLPCTDVVFLIDGYGQVLSEFESVEGRVHDLLARGGRYGIHVVVTANRWNEVRAAQQVAFANRIELRMTEPAESSIDGKLARGLPAGQPGRALTAARLYAQVALPRLDSLPDPASSGLADAAILVRGAWTGPVPPPIRVLPAVLRAEDLADDLADDLANDAANDSAEDTAGAVGKPGVVTIGRFESDFSPAVVDLFGRDQHLLALGDSGTGKTNLLRLLASGLIAQHSPKELVFAVFDPRHSLAGAVPDEYDGGHATNPALAQRLSAAVCQELANRDPRGQGTSASELPPKIVLLIDDYDVLSASGTQPLGAFVPYLASGRDLGLHVIMTRRVAGASRGLYEPFTLGVRESGSLGLLMSGDRTEGQLFAGVRPATLPVGRAQYVREGEPPRTVQTAYLEATA
jgi:S-DNA-T family DNA segregation ATPase FtsK/SpoIIIE